jgi:hypothetical protein
LSLVYYLNLAYRGIAWCVNFVISGVGSIGFFCCAVMFQQWLCGSGRCAWDVSRFCLVFAVIFWRGLLLDGLGAAVAASAAVVFMLKWWFVPPLVGFGL